MGAFLAAAWLFLKSPLGHFVLGVASMVAVALMLLGFKHSYDERRRDEGRAEIQAKWDADKAARLRAYTAMTTQWVTAQLDAESLAKQLASERQGRIEDAKKRAHNLPPADAALRFPASARSVLNDAVGPVEPAETPRPAGGAASGAAAAAEDSSVELVTQWAVDVVGFYNACRDEVIGWQKFYAALRAAQPEVQP